MTTATREQRLTAANAALQCFAPDTQIVDRPGGLRVRWKQGEDVVERRWQLLSRGNSWYPVWHRRWAHGGSATRALANLIRWIQGQPVLPLSTWRYWSTSTVRLIPERSDECCEILEAAGYPQHAHCVLCGRHVERFDWWTLAGVSGPCCNYKSGCRQQKQVPA